MNFRLEDHSEEVLKAMNGAVLRGLEKCGLVAEGYAKKLVNSPGKKGTGYLRNSITHTVSMEEKAMYIGSPVSYASFIEVGTGVYGPAHTSGYWVYVVGGEKHESKNPGKGTRWKKQNVLLLCCAARNRLLKHTTQTGNRQNHLSSLLLLTMRTNT